MPPSLSYFGRLVSNDIPDLLCFCHLRWDFVFQRPQHLFSRFAKKQRVFFFEEPIFNGVSAPVLHVEQREDNFSLITPHFPEGSDEAVVTSELRRLISEFVEENEIRDYFAWYYSPMFLKYTAALKPCLTVYDCMDELSNFKGAPPELKRLENELFKKADLVFTGGHSLYEAKARMHRSIHPFPSSIDFNHFSQARNLQEEPWDQKFIGQPRLGFYGVIDERMDLALVDAVAEQRPEWQFVFLGPIVKIDPNSLPIRKNIHYLGGKPYAELPKYLAGWDIAILPFARNEATRFISPTKTPEYLAGGKPVVSTSIRDVVQPYQRLELVNIADTPEEFIKACEYALANQKDNPTWLKRVDAFLAKTSWDKTWQEMYNLMLGTYHDSLDVPVVETELPAQKPEQRAHL